jgi:hypothetical protein
MVQRDLPRAQEDVLRLLDTRLACLLVDRADTAKLRPALFQLRKKLTQERLDRKTLAKVEQSLHDLLPPGTARASATLTDDNARSEARVRLIRR